MQTQEQPKAVRGTVAIEEKQGKWRIRLPRAIAQDSPRYIYTKLDAISENLKKVQTIAWQIEDDIKSGQLDPSLQRYSQQFRPTLTVVRTAKAVDLRELWGLYCDYRKSQVAATTFKREYLLKFTNHIHKLPTKEALHNVGMICPHCTSSNLSKNGHRRGKQNYICRDCVRQFVEYYSSQGYSDEIKQQCLKMYVNGMGFRAIERITGVNHNTVINWVKKAASPLPDAPKSSQIPEVTQIDELQTFVAKKKIRSGCGQQLTIALREF